MNPAPARGSSAALLGSFVMSWMFLFGMIGTGLVGPNRSSIEREFGLSHTQFGAAFALVQIGCSLGAFTRHRASAAASTAGRR